jgi:amino acid transporter
MKNKDLKKSLKPVNIFSIAIGSIIGFACFVLPGNWLKEGGPMGIVLAFFIGAIAMIIIGKSYGFMINKFPVSGGAFAFSYHGFGRNHAFICGWLLTLGYLSVISMNATALPILIRFIAPDLLTGIYLYSIAGFDVYLGEVLLSIMAILLFGYLNYKGSDLVGKIQVLMVILLFSSVILLGIGSFLVLKPNIENLNPLFIENKGLIGSILSILAFVPFAYVGFDTIPHASEEFDFSPSVAFKLITLAVLSGGIIYILVSISTAIVFPWQEIINDGTPWVTGFAMKNSMGNIGVLILTLGVIMAIFTGMNGFYLATSRLLYSMSRAKVIPNWFVKIHKTYRTPKNSIIFTMFICLIAPWFGRNAIIWIANMCGMGTAISFFYTSCTAYKVNLLFSKKNKYIYLMGIILSIMFIALLSIPGLPSFMEKESWIAFFIWIIIGLLFYLSQSREYRKIPKVILDDLILGGSN